MPIFAVRLFNKILQTFNQTQKLKDSSKNVKMRIYAKFYLRYTKKCKLLQNNRFINKILKNIIGIFTLSNIAESHIFFKFITYFSTNET